MADYGNINHSAVKVLAIRYSIKEDKEQFKKKKRESTFLPKKKRLSETKVGSIKFIYTLKYHASCMVLISCMVGLSDEICCGGCSRQPPTIIGRTMKRQ